MHFFYIILKEVSELVHLHNLALPYGTLNDYSLVPPHYLELKITLHADARSAVARHKFDFWPFFYI